MASAMFNMINRLNDTFWTELETVEYNKRQGKAVKGVTLADIDAYAAVPPSSAAPVVAAGAATAAE